MNTAYYEIPGGELQVEHLADGNFTVGKRWGTSGDFTTVALAMSVDELLTTIIEHTITNTLVWHTDNPTL